MPGPASIPELKNMYIFLPQISPHKVFCMILLDTKQLVQEQTASILLFLNVINY